jgi:hypothetical protein
LTYKIIIINIIIVIIIVVSYLVRDGHTQRIRAIVENVGRVRDAGGHGPAERIEVGEEVESARLME